MKLFATCMLSAALVIGGIALVFSVMDILAHQSLRESPRVLKDPTCRDYVAVPGEPCRGHRMLWGGYEDTQMVCVCVTVPVENKP